MNAHKFIGLIVVIVVIVAAFVHGSMSMSEGLRLALHGWWFIWKIALVLLAGGVVLVRRMLSATRPTASEACRQDPRT